MPDGDLLVLLGQRVRTLRSACGWTQQQLADAIGLSRTSVTNIEARRQGDVGVTTLARLATALGVGIADLLDGAPARFPWLDLARAVTAAEREHRRDADRAWNDHDYNGAIRARGIADGLDLARQLHLRVVAGPDGPVEAPVGGGRR
ncbi:helix-turn-helix domain-containing protein [Micromonospora costi]|uniref:XRE family transcriptional regulator n=1 Tax=Micromonospora costi TaxID=1530042 RepID=A0A3B0A6F7_9ACTN|nr:helix-turn-helix domain-containing protein [Micromonospora costi]RKN55904.1 XRE family transcriptional regulator [Micromonospora costi]